MTGEVAETRSGARWKEALARAVEDRDAMMRALVAGSSDLVLVVDAQANFKFVSPSSIRILGYEPEEWVGRNAFELLHPDDHGIAAESLVTSTAAGSGLREPLELRVRHASGEWRHVEIVANNLLDDPHVAGLVINLRDLSERRRAEATARRDQKRFEQFFGRAPIGLAILQTNGSYLRVNEAFCRMLARPMTQVLSNPARAFIHGDDACLWDGRIDTLFVGTDETAELELRWTRPDRSDVWTRATISAVRDDDGSQYAIAQIEDVSEQRRLVEELRKAATHDRLTGLANRVLLESHLQAVRARQARTGASAALLFIDLDHFKDVNDTFGHGGGDELLAQVADRLREGVRAADLPARLGGDEFVVLSGDLGSTDEAAYLAQRLQSALLRPYRLAAGTARVGASVGVTIVRPEASLEELLAEADAATYRAKELGRNRVEVFDDLVSRERSERVARAIAVRDLLDVDSLPVDEFGIIEISTREAAGRRLRLASDHLRRDRELREGAHASEVTARLELSLLRVATERIAAGGGRYVVSVSGATLGARMFVPGLLEIADVLGPNAEQLQVAVGEAFVMQDLARAEATFETLRAAGVGRAIDLVGSGPSCVSLLDRLDVGMIVLDAAVVAALDDDRLAALVVAASTRFARSRGVTVMGDGVRSIEELGPLLALGCDYASGPALTTDGWQAVA